VVVVVVVVVVVHARLPTRAPAENFPRERQGGRGPQASRTKRYVGVESGEGWPSPPSRLRGLGERRELPQRGPGGAPTENEFGAFQPQKNFWLNDIVASKRERFTVTDREKDIIYSANNRFRVNTISQIIHRELIHNMCKQETGKISDLVANALELRTRGPGFESRVAPLFHCAATLGKLFTHTASPVSQLQETRVQREFSAPKWLW